MAKQLVHDEIGASVQPLLPQEPPKPKGGRPRVSDRAALTVGIILSLLTAIGNETVVTETGKQVVSTGGGSPAGSGS